MSKATDGTGTVTSLSDGRWRARAPRQPDGSRPSIGIFATEEEARRQLLIGAVRIRDRSRAVGKTWADCALEILEERETLQGVRDARNEVSRFRTHLATACFATKAPEAITPVDVAQWLRDMLKKKKMLPRRGGSVPTNEPISRETIQRSLSLASTICDALGPQGRGLMSSNPCVSLEVPKRPGKEATKEKSTWLRPHEQEWFSLPRPTSNGYVREHERLAVLFSLCGVREGEQFNLELRDLHEDGSRCGSECENADGWHAVIRYGSKGEPVKNGKPYVVSLFGYAEAAARAWLPRLQSFCPHNYDRLVWPTPQGARRSKPLGNGHFVEVEPGKGTHFYPRKGKNPKRAPAGKGTHVYVDRFHEVMQIAGIERRVRWHDMRHTTGTSLRSGAWGDAWSLEEIQAQLNHSSVTVTQRYAKSSPEARKKAVAKVRLVGHALVTGTPEGDPGVAALSNDFNGVGRAGHDPATYGLKGPSIVEQLQALSSKNGASDQLVTNLAATLASLLQARQDAPST